MALVCEDRCFFIEIKQFKKDIEMKRLKLNYHEFTTKDGETTVEVDRRKKAKAEYQRFLKEYNENRDEFIY